MRQNRNGFSSFAKGLLVGSVLVAAFALLYAPGNGIRLRSDIPLEVVRSQRRYRPLAAMKTEKALEAHKPGIGWRMIFYFASAVAMISDLRVKKISSYQWLNNVILFAKRDRHP